MEVNEENGPCIILNQQWTPSWNSSTIECKLVQQKHHKRDKKTFVQFEL